MINNNKNITKQKTKDIMKNNKKNKKIKDDHL